MSDALVQYDVEGGVAVFTLTDPPANTYSYDMMRRLDALVLEARMDDAVHVIVVRKYATFALLLVCVAALLVYAADPSFDPGYIILPPQDDVWRWFVAPFLHGDQLGYAFVALVPVAIFGTLLERRFGPLVPVAIFVLAGAAGAGLAVTLETPPLLEDFPLYPVFGANGAALGMLCAWLVDDRMAARRGQDRENDLLGVYVIAVVLLLLSLTTEEANIAAAVGGAAVGAVLGLVLPLFTRKSAY